MSDLSGASPVPAESVRALARWVRARRDTLAVAGEVALVLAAAASAAALLGTAHAPSGSFVVQCFALGLLALGALRTRALRSCVPLLSVAVAASLVVIVVVEAARSNGAVVPLELAAAVAILPILLLQLVSWWTRAIAVGGATLAVVGGGAAAGMHGGALVEVGVALGFAVGVALVVVAGTDARRARDGRRETSLRRAMLRERRLLQTREEMIAHLSHDLRNPLAIALGFSEMAEDADLAPEERSQALSGLRRSLWEMSQLVENVLDGSADRAGALSPALEPLDLAGICEDALAATGILLRRRPIALSGAIEPGIVVVADRQRLARVLGNLLGNACKYTASGEIRLETACSGRFALIHVRDTGAGIAAEAVPFVFDRFRRAHEGGPPGVGLGLAIARLLVERMGGTLEVESALGVGSTFTVSLPLLVDVDGESVAA